MKKYRVTVLAFVLAAAGCSSSKKDVPPPADDVAAVPSTTETPTPARPAAPDVGIPTVKAVVPLSGGLSVVMEELGQTWIDGEAYPSAATERITTAIAKARREARAAAGDRAVSGVEDILVSAPAGMSFDDAIDRLSAVPFEAKTRLWAVCGNPELASQGVTGGVTLIDAAAQLRLRNAGAGARQLELTDAGLSFPRPAARPAANRLQAAMAGDGADLAADGEAAIVPEPPAPKTYTRTDDGWPVAEIAAAREALPDDAFVELSVQLGGKLTWSDVVTVASALHTHRGWVGVSATR